MKHLLEKATTLVKQSNKLTLEYRKSPDELKSKTQEIVKHFLEFNEIESKEDFIDQLSSKSEETGNMDYLSAAEIIREYS
ncbi:hypothetical protein EVB32_244 [Rhizobium phage RHph_TM39]|uniref:Uncharacterized protein n=1 Tax=Rhizobium phage RHph_TM30 TaxID=2509764 RepID=A0A7S5RG07_9CAUD|nr:hypothetical protein PQC16_gp262 [Rhizobium phage RHph_TM30]QIG71733.1 hypothetical protein EVB94_262 [Rhizobium phage RHph_TM40]QIG72096.1 hypothetical protein EVB95_262 [Rhizobium phage RHph_TM2_3B]QIG77232.1 hypothetical protein EVB32_244 [Rhizobium phage RHph_TM39]QIG77534.1 hypothetical protein EVB61_207 [Rhizobium phage RHph_TM21B]QIG77847.1 hypothetical protein EVB64_261 [Rhizobium phage RHph_TM61]